MNTKHTIKLVLPASLRDKLTTLAMSRGTTVEAIASELLSQAAQEARAKSPDYVLAFWGGVEKARTLTGKGGQN